jgi:hypothetical protein
MSRRTLVYFAVAALVGCSGSETARPNQTPSFTISDGAHRQSFNDPNGNPDFFFLPTMVPNPVGDPNFDPDDFNARLLPTVEICVLDLSNTASESDVQLTTPCKPGGYFTSMGAPVNGGLQKYQASWTVPVSNELFYRIRVKVGDVSLGFADVHTVSNPSLLKTVNKTQFVGQQDGSSLPIPFRIEIGALCDPPGTRPCDSATLQLGTGGAVNISTDGGSTSSGVNLPGQSSQAGQHTLTVEECDDLNPRAIDLPTFGSCISVRATPVLTGPLDTPADVSVCDFSSDVIAAGISEEQEHRITMHRLDGSTVHALPHSSGCPLISGSITPSFGSVVKELARGNLRAAVGKLAAIVGPTPLNARRRRLDVGGTSKTGEFSDFQFALPCKLEIDVGNLQIAPQSTTLLVNPGVKCTDLDGDPVANATIRFAAAQGSVGADSALSDPDGVARTSWTLGTLIGTESMTASGRGIAGGNFDGPRCSFDPFQPIQLSPHPAEFGQGACTPDGPVETPVLLYEGTRIFTANAFVPFGSSDYTYKVQASNVASPTGWQILTFAGTGFVAGTAPFAAPAGGCTYVPATPWTVKTDILVRKTFTPSAAGQTVQVRVAADNDIIEIYLNGVPMTGGPLLHTGCAVPGAADNSIFTGTSVGGTNVVAIRARDKAPTGSFLDVRIAVP